MAPASAHWLAWLASLANWLILSPALAATAPSITGWSVLRGHTCFGEQLEWGFVGNAESCRRRCAEHGPACTAFVLPTSGEFKGKCFFRSGVVEPELYRRVQVHARNEWSYSATAGEQRDCHVPEWGVPPPGVEAPPPRLLHTSPNDRVGGSGIQVF